MSEMEKGVKWWLRYVIVPLVGGGGVIALLVAFINKPDVPMNPETRAAPQPGAEIVEAGGETQRGSLEERSMPATIVIIVVPSRGSGGDSRGVIAGRVVGLSDPMKYRVALYAHTDRWYVQPTSEEPLILIGNDGSWESTTHLGSEYAALLVAPSFVPPESASAVPGGEDVVAFARTGAAVNP